ncbi:zinc ribbon domain-containing protein [Hyphomicrobium sp. ghe19]|uniref:zinc ribbon domain-containing protein n=1 Tax=Hyphomicrobium sp. ghe19 TaxID=2682968 RepID=UPI0030D41D77
MAGTEAAGSAFCVNCGTALQGKFCSGCGAPAAADQDEQGWSALSSEFLSSRRDNSFFPVVVSFLIHPVDTIIRLTDDPAYRSHWAFLTAMVGFQLTLAYVIVPKLVAALFNIPSTASSATVVTNEVVQYVGMAILTPIQYYVCRALGTLPRSPMSYVKLCVLSVSYGSMVAIAVTLIGFATGFAVLKTQADIDLSVVWQLLTLTTYAVVLVFVSASHKRFWGMSWPVAIGVTLFVGAMSWLVVYPALTALAERADVAGTLGSVLG